MKLPFLPWYLFPKTRSRYALTLVFCLLLCVVPTAAHGQSVSFGGAVTTIPSSDLEITGGLTVDQASNIFITDSGHDRLVELPWTGTGFGPQRALPSSGLLAPFEVAVDGAGDLFTINDNNSVVEIPMTASGYGSLKVLYAPDPNEEFLHFTLAADSAGNVFLSQLNQVTVVSQVLEIPVTATGYGTPIVLPTGTLNPSSIAVDSSGDLIFADYFHDAVVELPKTATGYGQLATLYSPPVGSVAAVAMDNSRNLFINETRIDEYDDDDVVEVPYTSTGYGSPLVLIFFYDSNADARFTVDGAGNVFATAYPDSTVELQVHSVNFHSANVCAAGATHPEPCSQTLKFYYNINADVTLGTPKVLTGGAPNLDFTLAPGSICTGARTAGEYCTVNVTFAPLGPGVRNGEVQLVDGSGSVLVTASIYGTGVTIGGAAQTIDFDRISAQTAATSIPLTATASSGLPVTFTSSTQKICSAIGDAAYMLSSGKCELEAHQAGNTEYYPAIIHQSLFVHHASQTIDFPALSPQVVGAKFTLAGMASSDLPLDFHSRTKDVCTVSVVKGDYGTFFTANMLAEGTCTIRAEQAGTAEYYPAAPVDQSFHVSSAP